MLQEGLLVYTYNHAVKGRNKIQDTWDSTLYRVVQQPREWGAPYSIVPVNQDGPVRQVHRTELRSVLMATCRVDEIPGADALGEVAEGDEVEFYPLGSLCAELSEDIASENLGSPVEEDQDEVTETNWGSQLVEGPRRSSRRTAGQHSNLYNLPRSVVEDDHVII